ncbi:aconitase family protein [Clostridium sp.]|uniref:aconitase family protein n=1 Tax=Clostridium sp. TaxID=1506 RepID=UPI001A430AE9|nr:aconitase family protein [Clostridium sp.]MBK5241477.1 hypothetical protein [Clostridium sp.]
MNSIYRLLAQIANLDNIKCGTEISLEVDLALAHDGSMPSIIAEVNKSGQTSKLKYGNKLIVTIDHFFPCPNVDARETFFKIKDFCNNNNVRIFSKGEGILHQVVAEKYGENIKDKIVVGVDGHICTAAALGALPFSITPKEMVTVLTKGKYNLVVPNVVNVNFIGCFRNDGNGRVIITGKDIALFIIGKLGSKKLKGNGVVFTGKPLEDLTESQKMTISNMMGEIGVKTIYFSDFKQEKDKAYYNKFTLDSAEIEELIALPGSPENVKPISEIGNILISQVFIGGCTNGRLDDMREVAEILNKNTVHKNVTLIICPASRKVANNMDKLGYSEIIRNSGGIIVNPSCGACSGAHMGVLGKNDIIVSTTVRNTEGRMGSEGAKIYLASPKVACKSAVKGMICK